MSFLLTFLWGWLAAAWFLGFATGWISVVSRGHGPSRATLQQHCCWSWRWRLRPSCNWCPVAPVNALDLALLLLVAYVAGCVPGAWLRHKVVARNLRRAGRA